MKLKETKRLMPIVSLFITIIINIIKIWRNYKDPKISNFETFASLDMATLILTVFSLAIFIAMNIYFIRKIIVWILYKFGRLDVNYVLKMTIKSESLETLKGILNETFEETSYFETPGTTILKNEYHDYKCNYSSLGSLLEIKYSSQNDDDDEIKKYEFKITGKVAINCLDKNMKFFQEFLDGIEVDKMSLTFLQENTRFLFVDKSEFSSVKEIESVKKDLVISTLRNARIYIHSSQGLAYLQANKKREFFHTYDDFKSILIN